MPLFLLACEGDAIPRCDLSTGACEAFGSGQLELGVQQGPPKLRFFSRS
jgi:hypothetical protein